LYEKGQQNEAQVEKDRLEEKQRAEKRLRDARGETFAPKYFEPTAGEDEGFDGWTFKGRYWTERAKKITGD